MQTTEHWMEFAMFLKKLVIKKSEQTVKQAISYLI